MPELIAKSALQGQAPLTLAGLTLAEAAPAPITSIAAFPGQGAALGERLSGWPEPNRFLEGPLRVWTGPEQIFLIGAPPPDLGSLAAVTDQTGGWATLTLQGAGIEDALARLYPLDPAALAPGHAARAPLGHMSSVLMRTAADAVTILVFRSMARTAWAEITHVLHHLSARASAGV